MLLDASSVFQPKKNGSMRHEEEIKAKGINTPVQILLMKLHGMMGTVNITPIPWL